MKKTNYFLFVFFIAILTSCSNPEKQAKKSVNSFFNELYAHGAPMYGGSLKKSREALNYSYCSEEIEMLIRNNFVSIPQQHAYTLTSEKKDENSVIVISTNKFTDVLNITHEVITRFNVSKVDNEWKIIDSQGLISFYLNFTIEDTQWPFYWDLKKASILQEVKDNLKLEIITQGKRADSDVVIGKLRLINKSNYDLFGLNVLIEHYDKEGVPVNTDNKRISHVIRSKGYREFTWLSHNCASCLTQTFEIKL